MSNCRQPDVIEDFADFLNSLRATLALGHVQATTSATPLMTDTPQIPSPEPFVNRHLRSVWRYLRMHGADHHEADDLVQEAFVTALRKGVLHLDPPAAQVFLRRAARFAFLHHLRDKRRDPELADAVDALWDRDAEHDGGEQLLAKLHGCLEQLEGRAKQAVQLSYGVGDCPRTARDDVAQQLGLQPNGLKTLLQRTRQALRTCIERATR